MKYRGMRFDRRDVVTYAHDEFLDWTDRVRYRWRTAFGRFLNRVIDRVMTWWLTMMADPIDD